MLFDRSGSLCNPANSHLSKLVLALGFGLFRVPCDSSSVQLHSCAELSTRAACGTSSKSWTSQHHVRCAATDVEDTRVTKVCLAKPLILQPRQSVQLPAIEVQTGVTGQLRRAPFPHIGTSKALHEEARALQCLLTSALTGNLAVPPQQQIRPRLSGKA